MSKTRDIIENERTLQSATDILNLIKTVDGVNSGLDANLLDGVNLSAIAKKTNYATTTVGGTVKLRVAGTKAYITTNGTNA